MSPDVIRTAAVLLVVFPTVVFGGVSILFLWITRRHPYLRDNPLRSRLWTAGHAHAGVLLVLSLVALLLLEHAQLGQAGRRLVQWAFPLAAILLPVAYFLSVLPADTRRPNRLINLAYLGAVSLTVGMLTLGIGLLRAH